VPTKTNMHEAKTRLSQLAEAASRGERVIIAKSGKPYVELIPCRPEQRPPFGWLKGQIEIAPDFDSDNTNDEVAEQFYGHS